MPVLIFKRCFTAQMFSELLASYKFGWAFVCFVLVWLFLPAFAVDLVFGSLISKPQRQGQRVQWVLCVTAGSFSHDDGDDGDESL